MALHVRERRALEITGRDQEATAENKGVSETIPDSV